MSKAISDTYKGRPVFAIVEDKFCPDTGKPIEKVVFSFGITKAKALLPHLEEFKDWCLEQELIDG